MPLETDILEIFRPKTGLAKMFEGACPNCGYFSEKSLRAWKTEITSARFPIIPQISQHPFTAWRPGQLPGWFAP